MKTSLTKLSSSFLLLSLTFSAWAKPVAQVINVSGTAIGVLKDGKTKTLKTNDHLEEMTEILLEEDALITINDYYDASYHLTGGSHLKFFNKSIQLKKGKAWIQSKSSKHPLSLTTANGHVHFSKSEFITTFDQAHSKTQVLVVNGEVEVSNILNQEMNYTITAGNFTLLDPEVENGSPRAPTKVGMTSLNSALAEFKELPTKIVETSPARAIASVEEESLKKGEIIFIKSNRMPASVGKAIKTKKVVSKSHPRPVMVKIYGTTWKGPIPVSAPRAPASVSPMKAPHVNPTKSQTLNIDPEFMNSLKTHSAEQPKHSKELESLIHDLKSF